MRICVSKIYIRTGNKIMLKDFGRTLERALKMDNGFLSINTRMFAKLNPNDLIQLNCTHFEYIYIIYIFLLFLFLLPIAPESRRQTEPIQPNDK